MFSNDVAELTCQKLAQENKNLVELNQRLREETEELKKQVTKLEEANWKRRCNSGTVEFLVLHYQSD